MSQLPHERPAAWPRTADTPGQSDDATELLIRARGFVERGWCRRAYAKDASARNVYPTDAHAVCWCAVGALIAVGLPRDRTIVDHPAYIRLQVAADSVSIGEFNDRQETVEPVLARLAAQSP